MQPCHTSEIMSMRQSAARCFMHDMQMATQRRHSSTVSELLAA